MKMSRTRTTATIIALLLALGLAGCQAQNDSARVAATEVYPELGYKHDIVPTETGYACSDEAVPLELISNGTITVDAIDMSMSLDDSGAKLSFSPRLEGVSSGIVNGDTAFSIPEDLRAATELKLANADFGKIDSITLCFWGGM